jgi:hypothetical protein
MLLVEEPVTHAQRLAEDLDEFRKGQPFGRGGRRFRFRHPAMFSSPGQGGGHGAHFLQSSFTLSLQLTCLYIRDTS